MSLNLIKRLAREVIFFRNKAAPSAKEITRDLIVSAKRFRLWILLDKVKPLADEFNYKTDTEIMILTRHDDVILLLCMLKSFFYFSKERPPVTVFDDGSLTANDIKIIRNFVRGVRIVIYKESTKVLNRELKRFKYSLELRHRFKYMMKKLDMPYYARAPKILMLDSDLLFFKKPKYLISFIRNSAKKDVIYMKDCWNSYNLSNVEVSKIFRRKLIPNLNSGIIGYPLKYFDFDVVEKYSNYILNERDVSITRPPQMQTIWSVMFSSLKQTERSFLPPGEYLLNEEDRSIDGVVCRHYVRQVRNLFYDDAAKILRQIASAGG